MINNKTMKDTFKNKTIISFEMSIKIEYSFLSKHVIQCFISFVTTYFYENTFFKLLYLKNKYRCKLNYQKLFTSETKFNSARH